MSLAALAIGYGLYLAGQNHMRVQQSLTRGSFRCVLLWHRVEADDGGRFQPIGSCCRSCPCVAASGDHGVSEVSHVLS